MKETVSLDFTLHKVDFQNLKEALRYRDSCIIFKKLLYQLREQEVWNERSNNKNLNYIKFTLLFTLEDWYELVYRLHRHAGGWSHKESKLLHLTLMNLLRQYYKETRTLNAHND